MALSGSVEGRSGSVIRPAPSCLREVREDEWLVLREPFPARLIGDDPVPVVTWLEMPDDARAEGVLLLSGLAPGTPTEGTPTEDMPTEAVLDFGSARPQTSQYPSWIVPVQPLC